MSDAGSGEQQLDSDGRVALEEERDFLLGSLDDLEREHAVGDIDEHDYRTLKNDYTARAAGVLRSLDDGHAVPASTPKSSPRQRLVAIGLVALVAVVAGILVMQASGRRGSAGLTGLDVAAASTRIDDCQEMEQAGDPDASLDCYSEILTSLPSNVATLTFRGWLQVREFDIADGLEDLDAAIQLDPDATAPYVFRASGRSRNQDAVGAIDDIATFYENDPAEEERVLADQFVPALVAGALDTCIDGDVTGAMPAVDVLQCYQNILAVDDGNPTASIYLGWLLARTGLTDEATTLLDSGLEADPALSAGFVFRAALRAHLGDVAGAQADLTTFDALGAPADQVAAASDVKAKIAAGQDPLG